MIDDSFLKERYLNLEKNFEDVKLEVYYLIILEWKSKKLMQITQKVNFSISWWKYTITVAITAVERWE